MGLAGNPQEERHREGRQRKEKRINDARHHAPAQGAGRGLRGAIRPQSGPQFRVILEARARVLFQAAQDGPA